MESERTFGKIQVPRGMRRISFLFFRQAFQPKPYIEFGIVLYFQPFELGPHQTPPSYPFRITLMAVDLMIPG